VELIVNDLHRPLFSKLGGFEVLAAGFKETVEDFKGF
jgi:hypothetical protein